eukprot:1961203-Rhodomonas_salina.2
MWNRSWNSQSRSRSHITHTRTRIINSIQSDVFSTARACAHPTPYPLPSGYQHMRSGTGVPELAQQEQQIASQTRGCRMLRLVLQSSVSHPPNHPSTHDYITSSDL